MNNLLARLGSRLELLLWVLAIGLAVAIALLIIPGALNLPTPTPEPRVAAVTRTVRPSATPVLSPTPRPSRQIQVRPATPTPRPGARVASIKADPARSGYLLTGQESPRFGDRNLYAGTFRNQVLTALIYFDLTELPPDSKVLYAEVELTGLDHEKLGDAGTWTLGLLPAALLDGWEGRQSPDFSAGADASPVGKSVTPADLYERQANFFVLAEEQRARVERAADTNGKLAFRVAGPASTTDNLFAWDGGDRDPSIGSPPILRIVFVPGEYFFITQTPTPLNVLTAAAVVSQSTVRATQYGTPTPLPRKFATVTPYILVIPPPTPANAATAVAQALYATAVAMTTGTFTPTPKNAVTATPVPLLVSPGLITPLPTVTPRPTDLTIQDYIKTPIPVETGLRGNILFQSNRSGTSEIWMMDPKGKVLAQLSHRQYYRVAEMRELVSPDGASYVDVAQDADGRWSIPLFDFKRGTKIPLIDSPGRRGIGAYHPAWSPVSNQIVYVSEQYGYSEIFVYDFSLRPPLRLTNTPIDLKRGYPPYNKHPSWSPDGKQIVFFSDRDTTPLHDRIWIMDANGDNLRCLTPDQFNNSDPIWVKK